VLGSSPSRKKISGFGRFVATMERMMLDIWTAAGAFSVASSALQQSAGRAEFDDCAWPAERGAVSAIPVTCFRHKSGSRQRRSVTMLRDI
jgi:hypothetical protein